MHSDNSNHQTHGPVFIAGCARSGTTYLRTLLDAHPDIYIPTESLFIIDYIINECNVPEWLLKELLFREPQLKAWYDGEKCESGSIAEIVEFMHRQSMQSRGAHVWGQKTPRFINYMDEFSAAFPDIRWILLYRDPRGVVASMLESTRHSCSVNKAVDRWMNDNGSVIKELVSGEKSTNILLVKFEELISNPTEKIIEIQNFIGVTALPLEELVSRGKVTTPRGSRFPQISVRSGLGPDRSTIDSWKKKLTSDDLRMIEWRCGRYMDIMGYPHNTISKPGFGLLLLDYCRRIKDIQIPFRYLIYWPAYLVHYVLRRSLFWVFSLRGRS